MKKAISKTTSKASENKKPKPQELAVVKHQTPLPPDPTLALIERAARDPEVDISKMRELLEMKKEHERDIKQALYQEAMCRAQAEMEPVVRKADNSQTNSKYAKLEHISKEIKPIYVKHGFSLTYTSKKLPDGLYMVGCWVLHSAGYKEFHELEGAIDDKGFKGNANKTSLQGLGSLISYLRRYLTCMVFDVILTDEDNDGNGDTETKREERQDKFTERATQQAPASSEPQGVWSPEDGVVMKGKTGRLNYATQANAPKPAVQALHYLKAVIEKRKHKASRIEMINENLPLMRAVVALGNSDLVTELHVLADRGE